MMEAMPLNWKANHQSSKQPKGYLFYLSLCISVETRDFSPKFSLAFLSYLVFPLLCILIGMYMDFIIA